MNTYSMDVHVSVEASGMFVEVHRVKAGLGWRQYHHISPASWKRLMYVVRKYNAFMMPYCVHFTGKPATPGDTWTMYFALPGGE